MLNFYCCHGKLALFSVATCRPLVSVVARRAKIAGDNTVTIGNTVILIQNCIAPYSTDNDSSSYVKSYLVFGVTINEHLIHLLRKPRAFLLRCHLAVNFKKVIFWHSKAYYQQYRAKSAVKPKFTWRGYVWNEQVFKLKFTWMLHSWHML